MNSNISSRSSSPEPVAVKTETKNEIIKADEVKKNGRHAPRTEKQMEALRKGMAKLKEKREMMAKEKEDRKKTNEVLKEKGLPPIEPPVKIKKSEIVEVKPEPVQVELKKRKERADKGVARKDAPRKGITRADIDELKSMLTKPAEVVVPVVKERVVEREKVLSGSELLNKIFFNK